MPLKVGGQCLSDHVVGSPLQQQGELQVITLRYLTQLSQAYLLMPVLSDSNHCQTLSMYCLHSSADTIPSSDVQPRCCKSKAALAADLRASIATEGAISWTASVIGLDTSKVFDAVVMHLSGAFKRVRGCRELRTALGTSSTVRLSTVTGNGCVQERVGQPSILDACRRSPWTQPAVHKTMVSYLTDCTASCTD